jgi:hypothetical protein
VRAHVFLQLALVSMALCACAGKLDHPERFSAIVKKFGTGGGSGTGAGGAAGAAGTKADAGMDAGPSSAAEPACVLQVFKKTCGLPGCHASGSPQVDLASTGVAGRLIDKTSTSAMCKGRVYIPSKGGSSLLLDKLGASPPCGVRMPLGGMLSTADTKCLSDWVTSLGGGATDAGAKP